MATNTECEESSDLISENSHQSDQMSTQIDDVTQQNCSYCGERSANLKFCMRCWRALYCNRSCQRKHWKQHKIECKDSGSQNVSFKDLLLPRVLLSVLWSEFARRENGEREMEVLLGDDTQETHEAGQRLLKRRCAKHPGHEQFLPITKLRLKHLPTFWRESWRLAKIIEQMRWTVKLTVRYTSRGRPDFLGFKKLKGSRSSRVGSGWIPPTDIDNLQQTQVCPIKNCPVSTERNHKASAFFVIETAAHVIYDDSEAEKTLVEFFYDDDEDKTSIVRAHGVRVQLVDLAGDSCRVLCVTHEPEKVYRKLTEPVVLPRSDNQNHSRSFASHSHFGYVISHPHGCSKTITFGELKKMEILKEESADIVAEVTARARPSAGDPLLHRQYQCTVEYDIPTCPGSSGGPVQIFKKTDGKIYVHVAPHSRHMGEHVNQSGMGGLLELNCE